MAIIPSGVSLTLETNALPETSKTYKLNLETGRIAGFVDKVDAVKQFVSKTYCTDRFKNVIYSSQYGTDWWEVQNPLNTQELIESELERILTEAIINDERISGVTDFKFTFEEDRVYISEKVSSVYGQFIHEQVITL